MKTLVGVVQKGFQVGSKYGIATANVLVDTMVDLSEGVYLVRVVLFDGVVKNGLLHWGQRKTFGSGFSAEVHILDFNDDLYGKKITIKVEKFVRSVQKFENGDALFTQIEKDIVQARKYFLRQVITQKWKTAQHKNNFIRDAVIKILHHELFLKAKNVVVYAPITQEVNFVQEICSIFKDKQFWFPKIENGTMSFWASKYEDLVPGAFGVLEPKSEGNRLVLSDELFVFVPGQAFDTQGNRLGRGGGFYDQFLKELRTVHSSAYTTAVIPKFAYFSKIPTEPHDQAVDEIILV